MKKSILNLGKALNKAELKEILGGDDIVGFCYADGSCPTGSYCGDGYLCYRNNSGGGSGNGGTDNCTNPTVFCLNPGDECCIY